MRKTILQVLFLSLMIATAVSQHLDRSEITDDPVQILALSTSIDTTRRMEGSTKGGSSIYMTVTGLDQNPSNNKVKIGPHDCIIADKGVSGLQLSCETVDIKDSTQTWGQKIEVWVSGKRASTCKLKECVFTYGRTPSLSIVSPRTVYPTMTTSFKGSFGSTTNEGIRPIMIGDSICDRFADEKVESDMSMQDWWGEINCQVSADQTPGFYSAKLKTLDGWTRNMLSVATVRVDNGQLYDVKSVPLVRSLSTNQISSQGGRLTISGNGFGFEKEQVKVSYGGQQAKVLNIDQRNIEVEIPKPASSYDFTNGWSKFVGGSGLKYTRYLQTTKDLDSCQSFRDSIRAGTITATVAEEGFRTEPEVGDIPGVKHGNYLRGYFRAPRDGKYKFYTSSSSCSELWVSKAAKSTASYPADMELLTVLSEWIQYRGYYQYFYGYPNQSPSSISKEVTLKAGELYYMEIFHLNTWGGGHFTASVEIPSTTLQYNSIPQIQKVTATHGGKLEIIQYKIYNTLDNVLLRGWYNLNFRKKEAGQTSYSIDKSCSFATDLSLADMNQRMQYCGWRSSVVRTPVDKTGAVLPQTATAFAGYQYDITYTAFRDAANGVLPTFINSGVPGTFTTQFKQIQLADRPIYGGTFKLWVGQDILKVNVDGKWTDQIPWNIDEWVLSYGVDQIVPRCESRVWAQNKPQDGRIYYFSCGGVIVNHPKIAIFSSNLVSGTTTNLQAGISSELSYNQLFQPIPSEILFHGDQAPQIQLQINDIAAVCLSNACKLEPATNVPQISSFTLSGSSLTVLFSVPTITFDKFDLNVVYAGQPCLDILLQSGRLSCSFKTLSGQPILDAGATLPKVNIRAVGYMTYSASLTAQTVPLVITSVTPNSGSVTGGTDVTIVGSGFPSQINTAGFSVKVGQTAATIKSITNRQITIVTPAQLGTNNGIEIVFNSLVATSAFTYDLSKTVTVSALDVRISSPYAKRTIVVSGSNFGTVPTDIKVFLESTTNKDQVYELKVNSVTDTSIQVRLAGGRAGKYNVVVYRAVWGKSKAITEQADDLELAIKVYRINNNVVSLGGGTIITIEGMNFDTAPSNTLVAIGDIANWFCEVVDITEVQIRCKVPLIHSSFAIQSPINVNVITRLQDYAQLSCNAIADCKITYSTSMTPQLTVPAQARMLIDDEELELHQRTQQFLNHRFLLSEETKVPGENHLINYFHSRRNLQQVDSMIPQTTVQYWYNPGDPYILRGSGFGANPIVNFGSYKVNTFNLVNDTYIEFKVPLYARAGRHLIRVEVPGKGFSQNAWWAFVYLNPWHQEPATVSAGGSLITFHGRGFDVTDPKYPISVELVTTENNVEVVVGKLQCFSVWDQWNSLRLPCQTTPIRDLSKAYKYRLSITDPTTLTSQVNYRAVVASLTGVQVIDTISGDISGQGNLQFPYMAKSSSLFTLTLTGSNFNPAGSTTSVLLLNQQGRVVATATIGSITATSIQVTFTNVQAGKNTLQVKTLLDKTNYNLAYFTTSTFATLVVNLDNPVAVSQVQSSYLGGNTLQISGTGFSSLAAENEVSVCGFPCPVTQASSTNLQCTVPALITENTQQTYGLGTSYKRIENSMFELQSDKLFDANLVSDRLQTTFYSSTNQVCFLKYDFGDNKLKLHQIRYFPRIEGFVPTNLIGTKFQVSYNGFDFVDVHSINSLVHTGWNFYVPEVPIQGVQAIRFIDETQQSGCSLAEIELYGWLQFSQNPPLSEGKLCTAKVRVLGSQHANVVQAVQYRQTLTPLVYDVTPAFGPTNGGTTITINGNLFSQPAQVLVDDIPCVIQSVTANQIKCVTGDRQVSNSMKNSFDVKINGNIAAVTKGFYYANRYSVEATWGGDIPPREGDSIVIPMGQTLLLDQTPPKLLALIIEGTLLFDDTKDLKLDASYIIIREGRFRIGSEEQPRQKKLEITLYGKMTDKQLPEFGNKMIACHDCTLDIHGQPRTPVWTELAVTAEKGVKSITVTQEVDWRVGEEIVIASTGWNHLETERRFITAVSADKKVISFADPLVYRHYSAVERYGDRDFPMRAEVGLLTRNVVIQGDSDSWKEEYGAHMMLHGKMSAGLKGRIRFAEFRQVGQPRIIGRYPIHFHMNGEMTDSYVVGNSIHDSFARCVTIHGTHFLRVQNNVGFNAKGHGIFMEDGIETNNIITGNLILGSRQSWIMLQKDITVSTYWITNPYNTVRDNRSGGSEWYGFWYEIKPNPDGPSATSDICPQGIELKEFNNNIAHSNGRFGLRILIMAPRKYPCKPIMDESLEVNQFDANPAIWSTFENFITFQNAEDGVLAEEIGNLKFKNMLVADSKLAGFQTHRTNLTRDGAIIENFVIVGKSRGNANPESFYAGSFAVIAPRTDGLTVRDLKIYNFGKGMTLFQSCSLCDQPKLVVTGGKNTRFEKIQVFDSVGYNKLFWQKNRREIFFDSDGTITGQPAYIAPLKPHFKGIEGCTIQDTEEWNQSVICLASQLQIRDLLINNPQPATNFQGISMKITRVGGNPLDVTDEVMVLIKKSKDTASSFATPLATGQTYNIHFKEGIDWEHLAVQPSRQFLPTDKGYVLRFNYTASRENFVVGRLLKDTLTLKYTNIGSAPDPNTCQNGDWWNDKTNRYFYICFSGKNKRTYEYVDINPVRCEGAACINGVFDVPLENTKRYWSNAANWANGKPLAGHKVVVPAGWDLVLDESTPVLDELVVNGLLTFDTTKQGLNLQAKRIWVKSGKIFIGSSTQPYTNQARIIIHGSRDDTNLLIDEFVEASNKVLAVTHSIELYGVVPGTVWTRLSSFADKGSNTITVLEAKDWKVGDELVIAPSGRIPQQHEKVKIASISGTTIVLDRALQFSHFGDGQVTINAEGVGQLDMRAVVGHLTRNIKISGNVESTGQGCRVLITQFKDTAINSIRRGYANIRGVEFDNCGQFDTERAALDFYYLSDTANRRQSTIFGNSFHDSNGMLLTARQSTDILVQNNVFYNGVRSLVTMLEGQNNRFKDNALIFVRTRIVTAQTGITNWAMLGNFVSPQNFYLIEDIEVANNVGMGSEDTGFAFMAAPCKDIARNGYVNNVVSSVTRAALIYLQTSACSVIASVGAFHSTRGIEGAINVDEIRVENVVLAENEISLVIKPGSENDYNNAWQQKNWYITALARPTCTKCYAAEFGAVCSNQVGYYMGALSRAAFPPPLIKPSDDIDIICVIQRIDGRVYIDSATFANFKETYPGLPTCSNNKAFKTHHGAVDQTCAHYLTKTKCVNCDKNSLFAFRAPDARFRGWFGGCGSFDCTGPMNVYVHDQDGSYLGTPSTAISNNPDFGNQTPECSFNQAWNGFQCATESIGVLNWMSIAPDYNTRLFSPVYLKKNGKTINMVNSLREWEWDGPEPMNTRESKFTALTQLFTVIDMENAGMNPSDYHFWISKRYYGGKDTDWVIIRIKYSSPQSLQVLRTEWVKEVIVPPFPLKQEIVNGQLVTTTQNLSQKSSICGANNYNSETNTIEFVITGNWQCLVRVRQVNNVVLTTHLSLDFDSFLANDKFGTFVNKIAAFLDLDPARVKVVGVARGSVIPKVLIDQTTAVGEPNTPNGLYDPLKAKQQLTVFSDKIRYNTGGLKTAIEDVRDDRDPKLTMQITQLTEQIAYQQQIASTEKKGVRILAVNETTLSYTPLDTFAPMKQDYYLIELLCLATAILAGAAVYRRYLKNKVTQ